MEKKCKFCKRLNVEITFHHLIPKSLHKKKSYKKKYTQNQLNNGVDICVDCHEAIHDFISEKELGMKYNTIETLLTHTKIASFILWVSKQKKARIKSNRSKTRR